MSNSKSHTTDLAKMSEGPFSHDRPRKIESQLFFPVFRFYIIDQFLFTWIAVRDKENFMVNDKMDRGSELRADGFRRATWQYTCDLPLYLLHHSKLVVENFRSNANNNDR